MDYNLTFFLVLFTVSFSFFYYMKCREYEKEFYILTKKYDKAIIENDNFKLRIKDLQKYKNDVSKTFKILDNELTHINNHVEKQSQMYRQNHEPNNVNLLTADMLNNLINNMNQESFLSHFDLNNLGHSNTNINSNTQSNDDENNGSETPDINQSSNKHSDNDHTSDIDDKNSSDKSDETVNVENHQNNDTLPSSETKNLEMRNIHDLFNNMGNLSNTYQRMRIFSSEI